VNNFFGERITVSGLITGQDLMAQLKGQELGERLYLPSNMLRMGENVFLDDVTVEQVEDSLQVPIDIVKSSGGDLVDALLPPRHDTTRNNILDKNS
jgi:NifB/MoaA-like Fe-S oxidoreductase